MDPNCSDSSSDAANEEFWNLANSSSDEEELLNLEITAIQEKQENLERERTRRGGSVIGRAFIDRNRLQGHKTLYDDYIAENPVHKELYSVGVEAHDSYFVQKRNSAGLLGLSSLQKGTAAIRMLAYGVGADVMDDYLRIGESTAIKSMRRFVQAVIDVFGNEYLRKPNATDISRLMSIGESRGFRGCFASITERNESGKTEQDKIAEAKRMFEVQEKTRFTLDHAWILLRHQPK